MALRGTYRQRHPEQTAFYQCLQDYWEECKDSYAYFYEKDYGPWRPVVEKNVRRFLDCGIFHQGFARVRCRGCGSEYILAFSCKTRYFCPSCQAKRVAAFVEWVTEQILEPVEHRQHVWTIPKVLRPAFRRDRRLLGELARCAWQTLREYAKATVGEDGVPGAILKKGFTHSAGAVLHSDLRFETRSASSAKRTVRMLSLANLLGRFCYAATGDLPAGNREH